MRSSGVIRVASEWLLKYDSVTSVLHLTIASYFWVDAIETLDISHAYNDFGWGDIVAYILCIFMVLSTHPQRGNVGVQKAYSGTEHSVHRSYYYGDFASGHYWQQSFFLPYSCRSIKPKHFWSSSVEKGKNPVLDFLSAALESVEYERALARGLVRYCDIILGCLCNWDIKFLQITFFGESNQKFWNCEQA